MEIDELMWGYVDFGDGDRMMTGSPFRAVDSMDRRNTLIFLERWSVSHGLSETNIFHT